MVINDNAKVAILMGSKSDWPAMEYASKTLDDFGIEYEVNAISAHRCHQHLEEYMATVNQRGIDVVIAAAGGAAHLAGVVASLTTKPVLGVPMDSKHLQGMDSLLSTVQMPAGIPVATFAIGKPGAINAALFTVSLIGRKESSVSRKLDDFRQKQTQQLIENTDPR